MNTPVTMPCTAGGLLVVYKLATFPRWRDEMRYAPRWAAVSWRPQRHAVLALRCSHLHMALQRRLLQGCPRWQAAP